MTGKEMQVASPRRYQRPLGIQPCRRPLLVALLFVSLTLLSCDDREIDAKLNPANPLETCKLQLVPELAIGVENEPDDEIIGNLMDFAVGDDGTIYLIDRDDPRVRIFNDGGSFRRAFGRGGEGPGEFRLPYRIGLRNDEVTVYDRGLARFVRFDSTGKHIVTRPVPFDVPSNLAFEVRHDGHVFVGAAPGDSTLPGQLQELDADFQLVRSFGKPPVTLSPQDERWLAWGDIQSDTDNNIWFSPAADYEIRRYDSKGTLTLSIKRAHDFDFNPRPYMQDQDLGGGRHAIGFDANRAMSVQLVVDNWGYIWHFVRDIPKDRIVVDVFDTSGTFVHSSTWPLEEGPGTMDGRRRFYKMSDEKGFPQLIRLRAVNLLRDGGGVCGLDRS